MTVQDSLQNFNKEAKRVLRVARKPDGEEYTNFAKVTGIGIILIGLIGFIIVLIGQLIGI
ncbi:MAG: protein translocase SEC61 complex subunit gamma [Methanobrevibacter boviskoreani]|jgi:protein transport protein SEC61 subunit gamma-like protein|uniref:protein translocase SEC61 complex subunit gamma n=1 Tax=Methanobrevibacter boviskoreani TaxID=1348249 RepID=UPI0005951BA1|nr:protein translocase SEC61 complex subunit gamma [Methanobrevibacter boviskoreani]MCI6774215.1 protein translocase SEC61 complex subunit gamma [Methanobrevibacter boviskoreani]MCI6930020.1 protein translocase SEC61 complex subunit gamma [Methanobrevibacter boviskoreani]MDD6256300.1 protein translocase SEC61 complex subunit gamma [Methanobrevibacter boviskoreani]